MHPETFSRTLTQCPAFLCPFLRTLSTLPLYRINQKPMISNELKLLFIQEELSQHGEWLADVLTEVIDRQKLVKTGALQDSIEYSGFMEGKNPGLRFKFLSYGRAVDISGYKENRHKVNTMRDIWGQKQNTMSKRRNRWYAKSMYSGYYKLVSRIMYGLSDLEIERLKGILENRKKINQ